MPSLAHRLYAGDVSVDFIGRRRIWYALSGIVLIISIASLAVRGINPSIDFRGGAVFTFPKHGHSVADARSAVGAAGVTPEIVQSTGTGIRVETRALSNDQVNKVIDTVAQRFDVQRDQVASNTVGATWGSQITKKALTGLVAFLVAVILYLSVRYEPKMALSAILALLHDLVITAGVYSLSGLEVSPSTVIALLTILGYSLYDTVVVFDKVRENTAGLAGGSRMTFSQATNLAINQTLMRSINTSIIGLLPVAGLLIIGAGFLGAGSLEDLSLALLIGLMAGSYSSIFVASPLLCDLKEREPQYRQLARRVAARQGREPAAATAAAGGTAPAPAPARAATATAVLDREDDGDEQPTYDEQPRPGAAGTGARPARPRPQQPRRRKGGRGGRPAKKRR